MMEVMHRRRLRARSLPLPLMLAAALLGVLGLMAMHTLALSLAPHPSDPASHQRVAHVEHAHSHPGDNLVLAGAQWRTTGDPSGDEHPCSPPGCPHDSTSTCSLTPTKVTNALAVMGDPATTHHFTRQQLADTALPPARPAPPSLIALSISRT